MTGRLAAFVALSAVSYNDAEVVDKQLMRSLSCNRPAHIR